MQFGQMVRTLKASEVASILREVISGLGGQVKLIISDNASCLCKNQVVVNNCAMFGVKCRTILPYSSTANGLIELQNKRMRHILITLAKMTNQEWTDVFHVAKMAINSLPVGSMGQNSAITPQEIVFGQEPDFSQALARSFQLDDVSPQRHGHLRKSIEEYLNQQRQLRINEYNDRLVQTPMSSLKEGTLVLLQVTGRDYKKGNPKYHPDLYIIVERNGLEVKLQKFFNDNDKRIYPTHVKHVKVFNHRDIKYFQHLDESIKRLLGHETSPEILKQAKQEGKLMYDFTNRNQKLLKIKSGVPQPNEKSVVLIPDSDDSVIPLPIKTKVKKEDIPLVESKEYQESLIACQKPTHKGRDITVR